MFLKLAFKSLLI